jgi:RimJ/RimL family protein N-acetyltransferase
MNDPEVTRFLESRFASHTPGSLRRFISDAELAADVYLFAIELLDGRRHIGNIKLGPVERHHGRADIGLLIGAKDCWGRGYATEAIETVTGWAFAELGLRKVTAGAYAPNEGSIRAFERAGYHIECVRRDHYVDTHTTVDAVLLARFAPTPR